MAGLQTVLVQGLTVLAKEKPCAQPVEALSFLGQWLLDNNPNKVGRSHMPAPLCCLGSYCLHATTDFMQQLLSCIHHSHATTALMQLLFSCNNCSQATTAPMQLLTSIQLLLTRNYCSHAITAIMHVCWVACLTDEVYSLILNEASDSVSL